MNKATLDEVEVLRFFETESLERATILFKIVSDKMRTRLAGDTAEPPLFSTGKRRSRLKKPNGVVHAEAALEEHDNRNPVDRNAI